MYRNKRGKAWEFGPSLPDKSSKKVGKRGKGADTGLIIKKDKSDEMIYFDGKAKMPFKLVYDLAAIGIPMKQITNMIGMRRESVAPSREGVNTDADRIRDEYKRGSFDAEIAITTKLFKVANDVDNKSWFGATVFWLKNRAGWRDKTEQHTTHDIGESLAEMFKQGAARRKAALTGYEEEDD